VKKPTHYSVPALFLLANLSGFTALYGQSPITSFSAAYVTTSSTVSSYTALPASPGSFSGCSATTYTYTFSNGTSNQFQLNSFNVNGSSYLVAPAASATVKLRRVNNSNVTGNRSIVYMESTFPTATACPSPAVLNFKPPYLDMMDKVLNAGMLNQGTDNIFTNAGNGDGNNNNIERIDVIFSSGLNTSSPSQTGFAIFDRGGNYQHDPFKIAAITSLDANGDPASFGTVKMCTAGNGSNNNGSWGHPSTANGNKQFASYVIRKDAADPWLRVSSVINQEIGGIFYTLADLGITAGQPLYGYALLAADGLATPSSAQLLNINDAAVYPTNTTEAQGGLDLVAVNTVFTTGSYLVLPLQIESFTGHLQQGPPGSSVTGAGLQWQLADAEGQEAVSLERSADGAAFSPIYSSLITQTAGVVYGEYTDKDVSGSPVVYYRLKITTASGLAQYSQTLTLRNDEAGTGWRVYPTVAGSSQRLKLKGLRDGNYTAAFYDLGGASRKVPVHVMNSEAWLDQPSGGLLPGIYWLQLSGDGQAVTGGAKIFIR